MNAARTDRQMPTVIMILRLGMWFQSPDSCAAGAGSILNENSKLGWKPGHSAGLGWRLGGSGFLSCSLWPRRFLCAETQTEGNTVNFRPATKTYPNSGNSDHQPGSGLGNLCCVLQGICGEGAGETGALAEGQEAE